MATFQHNLDYSLALLESTHLSIMYGMPIEPVKIAKILNDAGIDFVLIGGHATGPHTGKPRSTIDVDIVAKEAKKAANLLLKSFPNLKIKDLGFVIRLMNNNKEAIDIINPRRTNSRVYSILFDHTTTVSIDKIKIKIPDLEMFLITKFSAMTGEYRKTSDKRQDVVDFIRAIENNKHNLRIDKLKKLASKIYLGADKEIEQLVKDILAGKPITF